MCIKITILASKASLLYDLEKGPWKKKGDIDFDITMGAWDGAETCDICVLYLLSKVQHLPINIGAYRDDWLAVTSQTARQVDLTKRKIRDIFRDHGLSLDMPPNHTIIDFLDVTFNLSTGLYSPYMKPNNEIFYVHSKSNHPKTILKNLPKNIQNRLSKISANEDIFNNAKDPYQAALDASEYDHQLTFDPALWHCCLKAADVIATCLRSCGVPEHSRMPRNSTIRFVRTKLVLKKHMK